MNQQIRKFEQEAIVREVLNKLRTTAETEQKDLMKEPNYKVIAETIKSKNNIQIKINALEKEVNYTKENLRAQVNSWNELNPSNFPLSYEESYRSDDKLTFDSSRTWELEQTIGDKIAIALLAPDYKERLATIIDDIANELS